MLIRILGIIKGIFKKRENKHFSKISILGEYAMPPWGLSIIIIIGY